MIKLKNIKKYNLIIGTIIGLILAQIVLAEGYAILSRRQLDNGVLYGDLAIAYANRVKILATAVFLITVIIFNTKRFRKINMDKIGVYLFLSILVSLVSSIEGLILISRIILKLFPNFINDLSENYFLSINAVYFAIVGFIAIFLIVFILLVNVKVKYIKYITKEVKVIKQEGFGKTIEVKGGDEISELCKSINDMSVELGMKIENEKRLENNKNELITNISHDLKTPLTSIIGYLELLNSKEVDDKDKEEYLKIAYNKSLRLKSLVNELFEYTKLAGNDIKLKKNKMNISVLLNQAVGESIINFVDKNIDIVLNNPYTEIYCNIDSTQMLRVFENLIKNAEKYSDSDSVFKVEVNIKDEDVLISFMNKCKDFKKENTEDIFEKFYRNDKSRTEEGSGLGLAITKRIVELHEGKIWAEKIDDDIKFNICLKKV